MQKLFTKYHLLLVFVCLSMFGSPRLFAQTQVVQIGTGTLSTPLTLFFPVCRSVASSPTQTDNKGIVLYTQQELQNAGIMPGSIITALAFNKANNEVLTTPGTFTMYMKNSTLTALTTSYDYAVDVIGGFTQVYNQVNFNVPTDTGWVVYNLNTPFLYTGDAITIASNTVMTGTSGATGGIKWQYTDGHATKVIGTVSSAAVVPTTTSAFKQRANIKITFQAASPCTGTPNTGIATASDTTGVCNSTMVILSANSTTIANGITYKWQSSTDIGFTIPTTISNDSNSFQLNINPSVSLYYRLVSKCGVNESFSTPVFVPVTPYLPSGTYTINNSLPTGGSNYNSFGDAVSALQCGIAGPIVFEVANNTTPYTEFVKIDAYPNVNTTNTIRFNGNGATLQFTSTATQRPILTFDGAKYVTVNNLKIKQNAPTIGVGVWFTNNSSHDSLINSTIDFSQVTATTLANANGIVFGGTATSATSTGDGGNNNYIGNNLILGNTAAGGPYYGIYFSTNSNSDSNIIINNEMNNVHYGGIYVSGRYNTIKANNIHRKTKTAVTTFYGINANSYADLQIVNNKIHHPATSVANTSIFYGVYLATPLATSVGQTLVANNEIFNIDLNGALYPIYLTGSKNVDVFHNTISIDSNLIGSAVNYGIYFTGTTINSSVKNNLVNITGGSLTGIKYGFYYNTLPSLPTSSSNNNYYINTPTQTGAQNYGYFAGAFQNKVDFDLANPTSEVNSITLDPAFVDPLNQDFTPSNLSLYAKGDTITAFVPTDIDGLTRNITPTPGAQEIVVSGLNNAGVTTLVNPFTFCAGPQDIKVLVVNEGPNVIDSVKVNWSLDGILQTPVSVTTPLTGIGSNNSSLEVMLGNVNIPATATNLKVWTSLPNNQPDTLNANDTLVATLIASMSGSFTINNAIATGGTNFNSFQDFSDSLAAKGVCGPVYAAVVNNTTAYKRVVFNIIPGASDVNFIRVKGNGATISDTTLTATRALLTLDGTKYLTLDSLNYKTISETFGYGAIIMGNSYKDSIINSTFDLTSVTSTVAANSTGIAITGSTTSPTTTGINGSRIYIGNNILNGGENGGGMYYGITLNGASDSNVIENNVIKNFHSTGIRINLGSDNIVNNNDIHRAEKASGAIFVGIYTNTGTTPNLVIANNKIHDVLASTATATIAAYGIQALGDGLDTANINIYNNVVYNLKTTGIVYGMNLSSVLYNNYYHNTINLDQQTSGIAYGVYGIGTSTGSKMINNNIKVVGGNATVNRYGYYMSVVTAMSDLQKNNIFVDTNSKYAFYGAAFATKALFNAAYPNFEINSTTVDPQFNNVAIGDLKPNNAGLFGIGNNLLNVVATDILGNTRYATPTVGAYEYEPNLLNNIAPSVLITPNLNYCADSQIVKIAVKNLGSNDIYSFNIDWTIDGVAQPTFTYNDTLFTQNNGAFIDTVTVGIGNITAGTHNLQFVTSMPNGTLDADVTNDTMFTTLTPAEFVITTNLDTLCAGLKTLINLTPVNDYNNAKIWQSSFDGNNWNDIINTDTVDHIVNGINQTTYYRVKLNEGVNGCYSNTLALIYVDPQLNLVDDVEICGPGTAVITATGSANSTFRWYTDSISTTAVATGAIFNTPSITTTTDYYVSAGGGATQPIGTLVGAGTTTGSSTISPFYVSNKAKKSQYLIKAAELQAQGFIAGKIKTIGIRTTTVNTTVPFENLEIKAGTTTIESLDTLSYIGGLTTVYTNAAYTLTANTTNKFEFSTPIDWDGFSNVVLEFCFQNNVVPSGTNSIMYGSSLGFNATHHHYSDVANMCTTPTGNNSISTSRPKFYFEMGAACESPRQKVTVQVNDLPQVDLGVDIFRCADVGEVMTLNTGTQPAAYNILWDDNTNAPTRDVTASGSYTVKVSTPEGCITTDTINVNLLPKPIVQLPAETALCIGDTIKLEAGPNGTSYYWNTGNTNSSLKVYDPGTYSVLVTGANSCTSADTVNVVATGSMPSLGYIYSQSIGAYAFNFNMIQPSNNIVSYLWDFGDGNTSTLANPTHTYTQTGTFEVTLKVFSSCGMITKSISVHILSSTDIKDVDHSKLVKVYPNPAMTTLKIENVQNVKINKITITNILGQTVYSNSKIDQTITIIDVNNYISGSYSIMLDTDNGTIINKIQIIK